MQNWLSQKLNYPRLLLYILSLFNTVAFFSDDVSMIVWKRLVKARLGLDKGTIQARSMHPQWIQARRKFIGFLCTMHDGKIDLKIQWRIQNFR